MAGDIAGDDGKNGDGALVLYELAKHRCREHPSLALIVDQTKARILLTELVPEPAEIEAGALRGQGLELAWLESPVDAFFIHVQGSARLALEDGAATLIAFTAAAVAIASAR